MTKTFSDGDVAKIREALESGRDALGNGKWTRHQDHELKEAEEALAILKAPQPSAEPVAWMTRLPYVTADEVVITFNKPQYDQHSSPLYLHPPQPQPASGDVVTQCGHPSWTDNGGGKIRCAFCGVVGEERRYLLADRQQSTKEPRS